MKRLLRYMPVLLMAALFLSCEKQPVEPEFKVSPASFTANYPAQAKTLTITAPESWELSSNQTWVTPDVTTGSAGSSILVDLNISENTGVTTRTATLTLKLTERNWRREITVTQTAKGGATISDPAVKWIWETLQSQYYWNEEVKKAHPSFNLSYDVFLSSLLMNLPGARDDDGTMDGGYNDDGSRYIYSYVDSDAPTRAGEVQTFGFGIEPVKTGANSYYLLVTWVQPKGPADDAGLKRGMRIYRSNGANIDWNAYATFHNKLYLFIGGTTLKFETKSGDMYTPFIINATSMKVNPVMLASVVKSPAGKDVGYFAYTEFETGSKTGNGTYEYDNAMRAAFLKFKNAGVTDLVVDLRYNHGGYVSSCEILCALISNANTDRQFARLIYNASITEDNPEILYYEKEANALTNLNRVFVLAKEDSASASEMVISSLRGINGDDWVIHIGEQTEGKNVGMNGYTKTISSYRYELWPITFKIENEAGFSNYADGFTPTYRIDEFRNKDVAIYELGDTSEELLKAALLVVDGRGGEVVVDQKTRAVDPTKVTNKLRTGIRGGAKIPSPEMEEMLGR